MTRASDPRHGPPMGWNSWDCYGTTVTEAEVLGSAEFFAERLLPYGWDAVVIDTAAARHAHAERLRVAADTPAPALPAGAGA